MEVDMIVTSLADDILDSMHPRDVDGDGVVDDRGPLGNSGEALEPFLPDDERERRAKSAKHVRWAINVSFVPLNTSKVVLTRRRSTLPSTSCSSLLRVLQPFGLAPFRSSHLSLTRLWIFFALSLSGPPTDLWDGD